MRTAFPRIEYMLLVGIGGGVPSAVDGRIRIGDVAVSQRVTKQELCNMIWAGSKIESGKAA